MNIFLTGGTGLIGKQIIAELAKQECKIYVLVRESSAAKLDEIADRYQLKKTSLIPVIGDINKPLLGVSKADQESLAGKIDEFIHSAAIYDISASAESQYESNVKGTKQALTLAKKLQAKCFNQLSSIAAGGTYEGTWTENMFSEAVGLDTNPYLQTKHDSEGIVRSNKQIPWRIFRPSMVVGHSETGEIDKVDGIYYLFSTLLKLRNTLPSWLPVLGVDGRPVNIVPVDFVSKAIVHIIQKEGTEGECFHLTNPTSYSMGSVLQTFSQAANGPKFPFRINALKAMGLVPKPFSAVIGHIPLIKTVSDKLMSEFGIPPELVEMLDFGANYDSSNTQNALLGSGISVPELEDYAANIWNYWEQYMNVNSASLKNLEACVRGQVVVVTGASSGIGQALAVRLGKTGAKVILVARGKDKLEETQRAINAMGGEAHSYPCDLSDVSSCQALAEEIIKDHDKVDILVNNAGRSIRRSLKLTYDRFHDFERTMQLNYFGPVRLIMSFLPVMASQQSGHIINISSIAVSTGAMPRFSAYAASKSALDVYSRCAGAEYRAENVKFTNIHMPLVKTPMIGPTSIYNSVPTLTPEEAVDLIEKAILKQPKEIDTVTGSMMKIAGMLAPDVVEKLMSTVFKVFPDSAAAKGEKTSPSEQLEATSEQVALAAVLNGAHV